MAMAYGESEKGNQHGGRGFGEGEIEFDFAGLRIDVGLLGRGVVEDGDVRAGLDGDGVAVAGEQDAGLFEGEAGATATVSDAEDDGAAAVGVFGILVDDR